MMPMFGLLIVEDANMVEQVGEDWSGVRSPARARRRRARGFPQRIKPIMAPKKQIYRVGDRMIMHPQTARILREKIANETLITGNAVWRL